MINEQASGGALTEELPHSPGPSYLATGLWFAGGAAITSLFSASLAKLAPTVSLAEVLLKGMIVPSFIWLVQLTASSLALPSALRRTYWHDLGVICFLGSLALLPAAIVNVCVSRPEPWFSIANVFASVALMGIVLFRRAARHRISPRWPLSWCATITVNMLLFLGCSYNWW